MTRPTSSVYLEAPLLLRALGSTTGPVEIDDLGGHIVFVNNAWCELFGRDGREVRGARWDSLGLDSTDGSELRATWSDCIAFGHAEGGFQRIRPDGSSLYIQYTRLLYMDVDEASTAAITAYKPVSIATTTQGVSPPPTLAPNSTYYGVAILDADGYIAAADRRFVDLTGYVEDEVTGLHFQRLFPVLHNVASAMADGRRRWITEAEMLRKDGGTVPLYMSVTLAKGAQRSTSAYVVRIMPYPGPNPSAGPPAESPASELARLEHSLRNVLAAIVMNLELLDTALKDPLVQRRLEHIQRATKSGVDLLDMMQRTLGS